MQPSNGSAASRPGPGRGRGLVRRIAIVATVILSVSVAAVAARASSAPSSTLLTDPGCSQHLLARNDDGSSSQVTLPFTVNFFGRSYSSLWVNNNGNVTFTQRLGTYTPYQITADVPPIIAPFFADVDTRPSTSAMVSWGSVVVGGNAAFCVNWKRVGYYSQHVDKFNSFQLVLIHTSRYNDFDIEFNYGNIKWETGDASNGSNGAGGSAAGAGFSNGDGQSAHFVQLDGTLQPGAFLDGGPQSLHSGSNVGTPGRYLWHITNGHVVAPTSTCKAVYFISVRGSGQLSSGPDDQGNQTPNGSRETYAVWQDFNSHLQTSALPRSVSFYQLPYDAASTSILGNGLSASRFILHESDALNQLFLVNLQSYLASFEGGVQSLDSYVQSVQRTCAQQNASPYFVLSGYSQGAMVVHQWLLERALASDPVLRQVGAVALVADPMRIRGSRHLGTANQDGGLCTTGQSITGTNVCTSSRTVQPVPATVASRAFEVCNFRDVVCNTEADTTDDLIAWIYHDLQEGTRVHTTYGPTGLLAQLGDSIWSAYQQYVRSR